MIFTFYVLTSGLGCNQPQQQLEQPNIILISIDGLRADHVGIYGNPNNPTPSVDRLGKEGIVFENAFSQSNESLFSHAALFTGRYVSEIAEPDYQTFVVPDEAVLVSEVLQNYGYQTGGFIAGGHVRGNYGFDQGFDEWNDSADFGSFFHKTPQALAWLEQSDRTRPFFMIFHGYDLHRPYLHAQAFFHIFDGEYRGPADQFARRRDTERIYNGEFYGNFPLTHFNHPVGEPILDPFNYERLKQWAATHQGRPLSEEDEQHLKDHYDSAALAADLQIGILIEYLKSEGLWNNTLIIATADHGEDLGEHGFYNHRSTLHDSTTKVPLILSGGWLSEEFRGTKNKTIANAIDIVPTILASANAMLPAGLKGRDLLSKEAPSSAGISIQEGVLPMVSIRTHQFRLLFEGMPLSSPLFTLALSSAPLEEPWFFLYDLNADPRAQTNRIAENQEIAELLRQELLRWRKTMQRSTVRGTQPTDPKLKALLQSRGYW